MIFFAFIYKNGQGDILQGLLFCIFFSTILLVKQLEKKLWPVENNLNQMLKIDH